MRKQTLVDESGDVFVQIRSKRGTGTRDEDEVTVSAVFEDIDTAEAEGDRLNRLVEERMTAARRVGPAGTTAGGDVVDADTDPDRPGETGPTDSSGTERADPDADDVSKVYLGAGSSLSGWIPVPRSVVFEDIAPLVNRYETADGPDAIKVNFSTDVPLSGWTPVDASVVTEEIEPLVRKHRLDEPN